MVWLDMGRRGGWMKNAYSNKSGKMKKYIDGREDGSWKVEESRCHDDNVDSQKN